MLTRFIVGSPKRLEKRLSWLGFIGLSVMLSLNGCVKANIEYGQSQIDLGFTNIVQIDTMAPLISTTFIDSVLTSSRGTLLIGGYNDAYFGPVTARAYLELAPPGFEVISPNARFDSAVLYLVPNKNAYYGDTSVPTDIYVYQLARSMVYNYNKQGLSNGAFYSIDSFAVLPTPIGHVQQYMSPTRHDTVYIKLDSALGAQFFNDYRGQITDMGSPSEFLYYFPGIRLSSGPGLFNPAEGNIYGYKDSCVVKLWYNDATFNGTLSNVQFKYSNKAYQFNEVRNTPPAPLDQFAHSTESTVLQQIYSTAPGFNHLAYVDNILGYNMKIQFPSLRNLLVADSNFVRIQKAQLIFRPIQGTYNPYIFMLPSTLQLAATNFTNVPEGVVSTGTLTTDFVTGANTYYTFDVTSYLQEEINNLEAQVNGDGLIMEATSANQSTQFNRTILADTKYVSPQNGTGYVQTELVIYYLQVKNTL